MGDSTRLIKDKRCLLQYIIDSTIMLRLVRKALRGRYAGSITVQLAMHRLGSLYL